MDPESIAAIIFVILLSIFFFQKRKKIQWQGFFPLFYFAMLRTKLGLSWMDKLATKWPRTIKVLGFIGIIVGFIGMALLAFELLKNLTELFVLEKAVPGVVPVLPIKAEGIFYVPFFYWIISLFIIATVHEFSHGVVARAHKIPVTSSGFAFLGVLVPIIPAAFVEPDEKIMGKKKVSHQLAVFAAGPFSNIILGFLSLGIFALLVYGAVNPLVEQTGVEITGYYLVDNVTSPAEDAGVHVGEVVTKMNGNEMRELETFQDFLDEEVKAGETIALTTNRTTYQITLKEKPGDGDDPYLGVYVKQSSDIKEEVKEKYGSWLPNILIWITGLFYWLFLLNLGIGLFNLVPLGPIDGGRMLKTALECMMKDKKKAHAIWKYISFVFLFTLLILMFYGFFG